METGFVLLIPEAENFIANLRQKYGLSTSEGVPAHVTVLYPFRKTTAIDSHCISHVTRILSALPPFELTFLRICRFPNTVWLAPEPAGAIINLTQALERSFPECLNYGGAFDKAVPHLTVAQGDDPILQVIAGELKAKLRTPIRTAISSCSLFTLHENGCQELQRFHLAQN